MAVFFGRQQRSEKVIEIANTMKHWLIANFPDEYMGAMGCENNFGKQVEEPQPSNHLTRDTSTPEGMGGGESISEETLPSFLESKIKGE